jgi:6-phosphogluconolactonase
LEAIIVEMVRHLTGAAHVAPTTDVLFDALASALSAAAERAIADRDVFHLALSGGSTPEPFYMRLVTDPRYRSLPWRQTHVWLVDERRVPETDERSNLRMIRESLTDHVDIRPRNVHAVPVESADPGADYERELLDVVAVDKGIGPRMDFVLLGMGDDAHTASLFPGSDALAVKDRWVVNNEGPAVTPPPRVTMTFPLLNAARHVVVLAVGAKKALTIARVATQLKSDQPDAHTLPITAVNPLATSKHSTMTWFLDEAAAAQL